MSLPFEMKDIVSGAVTDGSIRAMLRFGLAAELRRRNGGGVEGRVRAKNELVSALRQSPIAVHEDAANAQHYALPPAFFETFLGKRMKYSSGYWPEPDTTLDASEESMLDLVLERSEVRDGMTILDLGCGWGSFTLHAAERLPKSRILAVSNSGAQRAWLEGSARARGLSNVTVVTANVVEYEAPRTFDRIVSVEMFEHMRNYERLLEKVSAWVAPQGKLFVHVFSHRNLAYLFEGNWMAERFFTGGLMPSHDLLLHFQKSLVIERHWAVCGTHYARTSEAWLARFDANREIARGILASAMPLEEVDTALAQWRLFFLSCAESFGFNQGEEWMVSHYLFKHA